MHQLVSNLKHPKRIFIGELNSIKAQKDGFDYSSRIAILINPVCVLYEQQKEHSYIDY